MPGGSTTSSECRSPVFLFNLLSSVEAGAWMRTGQRYRQAQTNKVPINKAQTSQAQTSYASTGYSCLDDVFL
jgi:L-asparagine transporter-like permease